MTWAVWLRNASLGILAFSAVELLDRSLRPRADESADLKRVARRAGGYLLAAALTGAYARFVPHEHWGPRSGVSFVHLPMVAAVAHAAARGPNAPPVWRDAAEMALWGAATGALLRGLGEAPPPGPLRWLPRAG